MLTANFSTIITYVSAIWLIATILRRADVIDPGWGPGFVMVGWLTVGDFNSFDQLWLSQKLLLAAVTVWGLRLGTHLLIRWWSEAHEDRRYAEMRSAGGPLWWLQSLFTVFWLQGVIMWIVALPLQYALTTNATANPLLLAIGYALVAVGLFFEVIGDWQLSRFRADSENVGRVLNTGLWRYTRHPNYFGDFAVWWGLFIVSFAADAPWWTVVSPLIMSVLLMKFSGVGMLERDINTRRRGYDQYVISTNAFFPWFPSQNPARETSQPEPLD